MRTLLIISSAAFAVALAGAGSSTGAASTHRADVANARAARNVTYLMHAEFGLDYAVEWTETAGDKLAACASWSDDRGTSDVVAGSTRPMAGRLTIFAAYSDNPMFGGWANISAVGPARGAMQRTLRQTGGTTAGCDTPPRPFRAPANDCGGGRERPYRARNATLRAEVRGGQGTLDLLTAPVIPGSSSGEQYGALSISVPGVVPYRMCKTSRYAPEIPQNMAILVRTTELRKLRALKPGERIRIERTRFGDCAADLPREAACRFKLDMHIDIRRWKPGTPYP